MKINTLSKKIFAVCLMWSCITQAGDYVYSQLQMKSYDDMAAQVKERVQQAEKDQSDDMAMSKAKLRDALQLIFSRPNSDNMVSQLVPNVRTPLRNIEAYETTVRDVAFHALSQLQDKKAKNRDRATSYIVLLNVMSELKPDFKNNKVIREIFEKIRDSKVDVPDEVRSELRLQGMIKVSDAPSEVATKIIGSAK